MLGAALKIVAAVGIPIFCLIYGFYFALSVPFIVVPYAVPILFLAVLCIWSLPDMRRPPTFGLELLLPLYMTTFLLWPDYLAIALPGLPWITVRRLIGFPIAGILLVCLSVSAKFRRDAWKSLGAIKPMPYFLFGFIVIQILTIPLSDSPVASAQLVFSYQVNWTCIFVVSAILFRSAKYVERYFALLAWLVFVLCVLTFIENFRRHTPWASHIPGFLKVGDEIVERVLKPNFRMYTNVYRAHATFFTPLALSECLGLMTPIFLHFGLSTIKFAHRICAWLMLPMCFMAIRFTDSRLGLVGMVISIVLYGFLWSVVRWRSHRRDILAASMVYGYPAIAAVFLGLILASGRLRVMVLGGNAQAGSNEQRNVQLDLALKALSHQPFGFGAGQAGVALGLPPGEFISVDNYFVTVAMDYGFLGAFLWYGIFIVAIAEATRCCLSRETADQPEAKLLAPLAVTLSAFLVVKWVHGQDSNHAMYFMLLGMVSALIYRLRSRLDPTRAQPAVPHR